MDEEKLRTIRLRILELALEHGLSTDKLAVAEEFEAFVFERNPNKPRKKRWQSI